MENQFSQLPPQDRCRQLSEYQRLVNHQKIYDEFSRAQAVYQTTEAFGYVLGSYGRHSEALQMHKNAVKESDKLPIELMQAQLRIIEQDKKQVINGEAKEFLAQFASTLSGAGDLSKGWINDRVNSRVALAAFYINPDGSPILKTEAKDPHKASQTLAEAQQQLKKVAGNKQHPMIEAMYKYIRRSE